MQKTKVIRNGKSFDFDLGKSKRFFTLKKEAVDSENRIVRTSLSSQEPYERYFGIEILSHNPAHVRMGRIQNKAPVLAEHDTNRQIGVVESAELIANSHIETENRMSKNPLGVEYFNDIQDGIRSKVSVGYFVYEMTLIKSENGQDTYLVTDWEPYEQSFVSVPADDTVGVGKSKSLFEDELKKLKEDELEEVDSEDEETEEEKAKKKNKKENDEDSEEDNKEEKSETEDEDQENKEVDSEDEETEEEKAKKKKNIVDTKKNDSQNIINNIQIIEEKRKMELNDAQKIAQLAKQHGKADLGNEAIQQGKSFEQFQNDLLNSFASKKHSDLSLGLNEKDAEIKNFSLFKLIDAKQKGIKCLETEISDELYKRQGLSNDNIQSFKLPDSFFNKKAKDIMRRDYVVGTPSLGGNLVATELDAANYIDLLRNKQLISSLGVQSIAGLVGNYDVPRQTSGQNSYWVPENGDATISSPTFDLVQGRPKQLFSVTEISYLAQKQTTPDAETIAIRDMLEGRAREKDRAYFYGATNGPGGLINVAGVSVVAMGTNGAPINHQKVVELETAVFNANGDLANMLYVTNPRVIGALKSTVRGSYLDFIMGSDSQLLNGYNTLRSNTIKNTNTKGTGTNLSELWFGNWSTSFELTWGSPDFIIDTSSGSLSGKLRLVWAQTHDFIFRHGEHFAVIKDIDTSTLYTP